MAVSVSVRGYAQVRVRHGVVSQVGASGCPLQGVLSGAGVVLPAQVGAVCC